MEKGPRGYKVFKVVSGNTGTLYYAKRLGRQYLLKEYVSYRFLSEESRAEASASLLASEERSRRFFEHLMRVSRLMRKNCRRRGMLNIPLAVFREGAYIYKVTRLLEPCGLDQLQLRTALDRRQMDVYLKTALTQLQALARIRYVHGDLKPENLVTLKKGDLYSAALIDYEGGFILGEDPEDHSVEFTPEYAAPEMLAFQQEIRRTPKNRALLGESYGRLSCAADMYSAGCVFTELLAGRLPGMSVVGDDYGNAYGAAALQELDMPVWVPKLHPVWRSFLGEMLRYAPEERPSAQEVLDAVNLAEADGCMAALEEPFRALSGKGLEMVSEKRFGEVQMGVFCDRRTGLCWMLWHLDHAWMPGSSAGSSLLERQTAAALRRRACRRAVLEALAGCPEITPVIPRAELLDMGRQCFVIQALPGGEKKTLERFAGDGCTRKEADRIMLELLEVVERLHGAGVLGCALTKDSFWISFDGEGTAHPFLAGVHYFLPAGELPAPEDMDVPADILSPELCMYLGCTDAGSRESVKEMIGPASDLFTLGLVYHLLLCGTWPAMSDPSYGYPGFAARGDGSVESGILFRDGLDRTHLTILQLMTAFEPEDRFISCAAAASAIRAKKPVTKKPSPPPPSEEGASELVWHTAEDDGDEGEGAQGLVWHTVEDEGESVLEFSDDGEGEDVIVLTDDDLM